MPRPLTKEQRRVAEDQNREFDAFIERIVKAGGPETLARELRGNKYDPALLSAGIAERIERDPTLAQPLLLHFINFFFKQRGA